MASHDVSINVNISSDDLEALQLIAQVTDQKVGDLIRDGVGRVVYEFSQDEEFAKKAREAQKRNEAVLNRLLGK